jgi:hypothetical protein
MNAKMYILIHKIHENEIYAEKNLNVEASAEKCKKKINECEKF